MSINVVAFFSRKSGRTLRQFLFLALIHGATSMFGGLFLFLVLPSHAKAAESLSPDSFSSQVVSEHLPVADKHTAVNVSTPSEQALGMLERPSIRRYSAADAAAEFDAKVQHANRFSSGAPTPLFGNSTQQSELSIADRNHVLATEPFCASSCTKGVSRQ